MKFLVKSPCADCPFRASCHPFLRRAYAIARELRDDTRWFACHETTGVKHGRRVKGAIVQRFLDARKSNCVHDGRPHTSYCTCYLCLGNKCGSFAPRVGK